MSTIPGAVKVLATWLAPPNAFAKAQRSTAIEIAWRNLAFLNSGLLAIL